MKTMNVPGFTAEQSLNLSRGYYHSGLSVAVQMGAIIPAIENGIWPSQTSTATLDFQAGGGGLFDIRICRPPTSDLCCDSAMNCVCCKPKITVPIQRPSGM